MRLFLLMFLAGGLLPLFVGTRRTAAAGLAAQGLSLAALHALRHEGLADAVIGLVDMGLIRGLVVPLVLLRARRHSAPLLSRDLFLWSIAGMLVVLGFWFAGSVDGSNQLATGTWATVLLGGLFALSRQGSRAYAGQVVGAVMVENAVALAALSSREDSAWPVSLGLALAFAVSIAVFARLLAIDAAPPAAVGGDAAPAIEEATL